MSTFRQSKIESAYVDTLITSIFHIKFILINNNARTMLDGMFL